MGFWFNNFCEFERKKNRRNRLILNFYYAPSSGEKAKRIKTFARTNITIPTSFIYEGKKVEEIKEKIEKDEELKKFYLGENNVGKFRVLEIEMPYEKEFIDKLPDEFEKADYDKFFRFKGVWPERKINISPEIEKKLLEKEENEKKYSNIIERLKKKNKRERNNEKRELRLKTIKNLENKLYEDAVDFQELEPYFSFESPNEQELRKMSWLYLDIEKPLWKNEDEKKLLKARKRLLKLDRKLENQDGKHELRGRAIKNLEARLTINVEDVGEVRLWEEKYNADISFIVSDWENPEDETKKEIKELYVLDPNNEFEKEEVKGYKVFKFKTEKELVKYFMSALDKRKPVLASGHNEVYDITQIRFAAEGYKENFTPAVKGVKPRRDYVRYFFQRMKEDLIYIDSMWLNAILYPWIRQKSLGTSLKLGDAAKFHGLDFEKSLTHEQLREVELQRLFGKTKKIREKAAKRLVEYTASDLEPSKYMIENTPFLSLITKMKTVLPYCTLTEIAFAPNCVNKYHDKEHFEKVRNHRYYGDDQKTRENEIQISKKRFASLKKQMLKHVGISTSPVYGKHENVYEIYLLFEEWIKNAIFKTAWQFKWLYNEITKEEKIGFLQYLKALERDMLVDYYFARREAKIFKDPRYPLNEQKFRQIEEIISREGLDSYYASFKYLKENFRSIYVNLSEKSGGRALIRLTKKNLSSIEFPSYMEDDADLYLVRKNAMLIEKKLSPKQKPTLKAFLTNFINFEEKGSVLGEKIKNEFKDQKPEQLLFLYNQNRRKEKREKMFFARYKMGVGELKELISNSYRRLAYELGKYNLSVIDRKGDYLFVKADEKIKDNDYFYVVRELKEYEVKKRIGMKNGKKTDRQLTLFK